MNLQIPTGHSVTYYIVVNDQIVQCDSGYFWSYIGEDSLYIKFDYLRIFKKNIVVRTISIIGKRFVTEEEVMKHIQAIK